MYLKTEDITRLASKLQELWSSLRNNIDDREQIIPKIKPDSVITVKGTLSGLRHFLATESPLKMMKNAFYFTTKVLFILKIFKFSS